MDFPTLKELAYQFVDTRKVPPGYDVHRHLTKIKPRLELRDVILSLIQKHDGHVYGGFVRDLFAGVPFRDIDVYFTSEKCFNRFTSGIISGSSMFRVIKCKKVEGYKREWIQRKISLKHVDDTTRIDLDVSYAPHFQDYLYEFDFDVNQLELSFDKTNDCVEINGFYVKMHPLGKGSLKEIINRIRRKEFVVIKHETICFLRDYIGISNISYKCILDRMKERTKRGWKAITRCKNYKCIFSFEEGLLEYKSKIEELKMIVADNRDHLTDFMNERFTKNTFGLSTLQRIIEEIEMIIAKKIAKKNAPGYIIYDSEREYFRDEAFAIMDTNIERYERRIKSKQKGQRRQIREDLFKRNKVQDQTISTRNKMRIIREAC